MKVSERMEITPHVTNKLTERTPVPRASDNKSELRSKMTFDQLESELVRLINAQNEADDLPGLIYDINANDMSIRKFCCKLWWTFILSCGVQAVQVYLTYELLLESTKTHRSEIAKWIDEGSLRWKPASEHDSGSSGYDFERECKRNSIHYVDILTTNIVVPTQRGRQLIWANVAVGALILSFHVTGDIVSMFFDHKYQIVTRKEIGYRRVSCVFNFCRVVVGTLVLLGQIMINIFVGVVCAGAIASSCLDIGGIILAGVGAYFILSLDDIVFGAFKKCLGLTGHKIVSGYKTATLRERGSKTTIFTMFSTGCTNLRNMKMEHKRTTPLHKAVTCCSICCCFGIPVALMFALCVVSVVPIFLCIAAIWNLGTSGTGTVLEQISQVKNHTTETFVFPFFHRDEYAEIQTP